MGALSIILIPASCPSFEQLDERGSQRLKLVTLIFPDKNGNIAQSAYSPDAARKNEFFLRI